MYTRRHTKRNNVSSQNRNGGVSGMENIRWKPRKLMNVRSINKKNTSGWQRGSSRSGRSQWQLLKTQKWTGKKRLWQAAEYRGMTGRKNITHVKTLAKIMRAMQEMGNVSKGRSTKKKKK